MDDDDTQVYKDHGDALTIAYQSGYYDGKKAAQAAQEPVCPACKAGVLYECVACSSNNYPPQPVQEPWCMKMNGCTAVCEDCPVKVAQRIEQEPVAFYNPQQGGFYWAKPTTISCPQTVDVTPLALYTHPPQRTEQEKHWDVLGEEQAAAFERDGRVLFQDAMVRAVDKVMAEFEARNAAIEEVALHVEKLHDSITTEGNK